MPNRKLTLARLEGLLLTACDDPRGNMYATDLFDQPQEETNLADLAVSPSTTELALTFEYPDQYSGKYFNVPGRAGWNGRGVGFGTSPTLEQCGDHSDELSDVRRFDTGCSFAVQSSVTCRSEVSMHRLTTACKEMSTGFG